MHGRVKVKTTAEIAEQKKLERLAKINYFDKLKDSMFESKINGDLTEDALIKTEKVLSANQDFYTAWNYRREILTHLISTRKKSHAAQAKEEMKLTAISLPKNPKSYWIWNHRRWATESLPMIKCNAENQDESSTEKIEEYYTDWKKEISLTNDFLAMDERNFHCWDYRRFVVKKCKHSSFEELKFTTKLIERNFSNYSAWHYRSSLLPILYPAENTQNNDGSCIQESVLLNELDLVQNACFTEPDDQSAWLYLRWLLGKAQQKLAVRVQYAWLENGSLKFITVFSQPVKVISKGKVVIGEEEKELQLVPVTKGTRDLASNIVYGECTCEYFSENKDIVIVFDDYIINSIVGSVRIEPISLSFKINGTFFVKHYPVSPTELHALTRDNFESQLENCNELLELEPDSKWTLITTVYLMQALISSSDSSLRQKIMENLEKLKELDTYRSNYYNDFYQQFFLEEKVIERLGSLKHNDLVLLENMSLTYLPNSSCQMLAGICKLSLCKNSIRNLENIGLLLNLKELYIDDNNLKKIVNEINMLKKLVLLSACNNNIKSFKDLFGLKGTSLSFLKLKGNPVELENDFKSRLIDICGPTLKTLDSIDIC